MPEPREPWPTDEDGRPLDRAGNPIAYDTYGAPLRTKTNPFAEGPFLNPDDLEPDPNWRPFADA